MTDRTTWEITPAFRSRILAALFFLTGVFVAMGWVAFLNVIGISEGHPPIAMVYAVWLTFPVLHIPWPGFSSDGISGGAVWGFFTVVIVANGLLYAAVGTSIYRVQKLCRSRWH